MSCSSDKIINPKTRKCVLKTGKIGQEILKNKKKVVEYECTGSKCVLKKPAEQKLKDTDKKNKCPSDKIINPKTGKCVLKSGKVGQEILKTIVKPTKSTKSTKSSKSVKPIGNIGVPSEFKKIAEDCSRLNEWEQRELLGEGQYGKTYRACNQGNCEYVLKSQKADSSFRNEVQALEELQKTKDVPKLYAAWTCGGVGYIVLEQLFQESCPSKEETFKQLKKSLDNFKKYGWLHVDIHDENYMCTKEGKVVPIDFGWAAKNTTGKDDQLFPDHPLSGYDYFDKPVPWYVLVASQDFNLEKTFGSPMAINYRNAVRKWCKEDPVGGQRPICAKKP